MAPSILTEESLWYVCHLTTAAWWALGLVDIVAVWALNRSRFPLFNVFLDYIAGGPECDHHGHLTVTLRFIMPCLGTTTFSGGSVSR